MITLQKNPNKDFKLLNLADIQLSVNEWQNEKAIKLLKDTLNELIFSEKPDLITLSGDQSYGGQYEAYENLFNLLDGYKIPYATVWGNHDNQGGAEAIENTVKMLEKHKYAIYERGPAQIGNGNYPITIEENGKPVFAVIMMDTHDRTPFINSEGKEALGWGRMMEEQIDWLYGITDNLKEKGVENSAIICHIPVYGFIKAFDAAFNKEYNPPDISISESFDEKYWNDGFKGLCFGLRYEGECPYPVEENMLQRISGMGIIRHIIVGHDHANCWSVPYMGVRLSYGLKTGRGCYWNENLNGGSVLEIHSNGSSDFRHHFIKPSVI